MHVTQRGVNRAATFVDDDDRFNYLHLLRSHSQACAVAVHAYVLMGNHVHLLVSASEYGAVSQLMRIVGQCHVQMFNRRHDRTGTLWEGRFKSCLVDSERYLLTVYRYIELNPVRAAMVEAPQHYRWSSVHANLALRAEPLVTPHASFIALGSDAATRATAYRQWLSEGVSEDDLAAIRIHLRQERAMGDARFQRMVEKALYRPAACTTPSPLRLDGDQGTVAPPLI